MVDSLDRLFLYPQLLLKAGKVDLYDAINLVVYAKVPLVTVRRGKELVAGSIRLDEAGSAVGILSQGRMDDLLGKYENEIASFRYPVGPAQYESLLVKMIEAGEDVLPYFFHEHHHVVDRRCRATLFTQLHGELAVLVSKGKVPLQVTDSEGTHLMASKAWMTAKTLAAYLERQRVTPWWDNEENLRSHARLERILLSNEFNVVKSDSSDLYDRQQLPSFLFGHMLLKRTRVPFGYAQTRQRRGDARPVEAHAPDWEFQNSQYKPNQRIDRAETIADAGAMHTDRAADTAKLHPVGPQPPTDSGDALATHGKRKPRIEHGFDEASIELSEQLPPPDSSSEETMLTKAEVAKMLGVSVNTVDNYRKKADFPKEISYGSNAIRWERREILQWRDRQKKK